METTNLIRKCSSLKSGEKVVFMEYNEILERKAPIDGNVVTVVPDLRVVDVTYLYGYHQRWARVPYECMLGVFNQDAPIMYFENICGPSDTIIPE